MKGSFIDFDFGFSDCERINHLKENINFCISLKDAISRIACTSSGKTIDNTLCKVQLVSRTSQRLSFGFEFIREVDEITVRSCRFTDHLSVILTTIPFEGFHHMVLQTLQSMATALEQPTD